jgi:hypothetical protein
MNNTNNNQSNSFLTNEDYFNFGKSDAWVGKPKRPPEDTVEGAELYDLGYNEGMIEYAPIQIEKS